MSGIRIVVVSDRRLSSLALAGVLDSIPGSRIVAEVDQVGAAKCYCERGEADAIMVDASVVVQDDVTSGRAATVEAALGTQALWRTLPAFTASHDLNFEWVIQRSQLDMLTPREMQVFTLLGTGLSNRHIGKQLGVTERTVKSHVGRVLAKLNLESRLQAGLAAFVHGVLTYWVPAADDPADSGEEPTRSMSLAEAEAG